MSRVGKRTRGLAGRTLAAALLVALPLSACSSQDETAEGPQISNETLASALAGAQDVGRMSDAFNATGLAQVFDGTAAYTVLAPTDAAFAALEEADEGASELSSESGRALMAAILREHVLPGALGPDDINRAIEVQNGPVKVQTMGSGTISFAKLGDRIQATDASGNTALLSPDAIRASNGVVIPIDKVLKQP